MENELYKEWKPFAEAALKRFYSNLIQTSATEIESLTQLTMLRYIEDSPTLYRVLEDEEILNRLFVLTNDGQMEIYLQRINHFLKLLTTSFGNIKYHSRNMDSKPI